MNQSPHFPDSFYRVTIKGMCVEDGKLLMMREAESLSGKWELPGGGLDFGEDIQTAFHREVQEEMGLEVSSMSKDPLYAWPHKYSNNRGLDWFYSMVLAYKVSFKDLNFTPSEECAEIAFFTPDEIKTLDLDGQMKDLLTYFNPEDFA